MDHQESMTLDQAAQTSEVGAQFDFAWELVKRGIGYHMLDTDQLPELISHLKEERDYCVDELAFEFVDGELEVRLLKESESTDKATMIQHLESLLNHVRGYAQ